jgi:hypothetical protein
MSDHGADENGTGDADQLLQHEPPPHGEYVRVHVKHGNTDTLVGFIRSSSLTVEELIKKILFRLSLPKPASEYALYVAYGRKQIRVFESSDLKDDDQCELVLLPTSSKSPEKKSDEEEDDDDDKTVPMSSTPAKDTTAAPSPPPAPAPQVTSRASRSSAKKEKKEPPPKEPPKRTASKRASAKRAASPPPPPPAKEEAPTKKSRKVKPNSTERKTSRAITAITKKNKESLEPETRLLLERYNDGHFYEVIFKRYLSEARRQKADENSCWVFVHFVEKDLPEREWSKCWIDLNTLRTFLLDDDQVMHLDEWEPDDDEEGDSFLGKRLIVKWKDGNKYSGTVTRTIATNTNIVFIEYDDGDQCWSDLNEELDVLQLLPESEEGDAQQSATTGTRSARNGKKD